MTVRKEDNGTWSVRCWYRNWKGERKQKTKRGFKKLKDAKEWERDFLASEHNEIVTMSQLIQSFLDDMHLQESTGALKHTTVATKERNIEQHIKPYFKAADASNVTIKVVNEWLLAINKTYYGHKRASNTILLIRNILSQIFKHGMKHYGLKENPVTLSNIPAYYTHDERQPVWSVDTYNVFYNSLTEERHRVLYNCLYWAGLRIGELLALTPADIQGNIIDVNKTWVTPSKGSGYATTPKTLSSCRNVVMPAFLAQQLQDYIASIDGIKPTDRIFPYGQSTAGKFFAYRIEKLGLPKASLHTLRHSFASNVLEITKDYVATAALLGHSTAETTYKHYAFTINDSMQKSVDALSKLHKN